MTNLITGETWGDEVEGVRAFLLQQSERPLAELRPEAEAAHAELLAALAGVSEVQAAFRPATGEGEDAWGIAEGLRHVVSVEAIMAERIRGLGLGETLQLKPTYAGYMEDIDTRRLPVLVDALAASHSALDAAIAAIDGHERLDTFDQHRRFGDLNCRGWLAMHALHLRDHARQIGRIKAMPGYPV